LDAEGNVAYLINTTANITAQILNHWELTEAREMKAAFSDEQDRNEALLAFNENLSFDNVQLGLEQKLLQELIARLTEKDIQLEQAELTLRLAVEAANVGTWYIHCANRELRVSTRSKELFGYNPEDTMTLNEVAVQVVDDHRERIKATIEQAILTVGSYDESYPVMGFHDRQVRWVRAQGNTSVQAGGFLAFTGVIMDITDLKEDEQRKSDFISMVSHELKSPLTSLSGYAQILSARAKNSEDTFTAGMLDKMNGQVKKMTGMINGFLSKGHLESGKIHLQFTQFNLEDLVREWVDEVNLTVTAHRVSIGNCESVEVFADRDKISNVISNLLSNALKYSPNGGHIMVSCITVSGRAQVSVKDEGLGILAKDRITLFERYKRIRTEHTEKIAGFGIGLYLCAEIVRRHKGEIWVESEPGTGSTFFFNLPLLR
jgi:PAS domain S-box-containing protein